MTPPHALTSASAMREEQTSRSSQKPAPHHVAIIMDGNGRWARSKGMPRTAGHRKGAEALKTLLGSLGRFPETKYITLYAFSSENWQRPESEVTDLMGLLQHYLQKEARILHKNRIRLHVIGDRQRLSPHLRKGIETLIEETQSYDDLHLCIALSYGARQEITHAVQILAEKVGKGLLEADQIDESLIEANLYTAQMPEPDLLIRTGGEQRLSNFLLWQSAYTEFYFTPVLWPDFTANHLEEAIACYCGRERRYGNL